MNQLNLLCLSMLGVLRQLWNTREASSRPISPTESKTALKHGFKIENDNTVRGQSSVNTCYTVIKISVRSAGVGKAKRIQGAGPGTQAVSSTETITSETTSSVDHYESWLHTVRDNWARIKEDKYNDESDKRQRGLYRPQDECACLADAALPNCPNPECQRRRVPAIKDQSLSRSSI
ncbi:hypothetical protein ACLMJK_009515 [Lecanora helva]